MRSLPPTLLSGRLRTSTLLLCALFLAVLTLYLLVRPVPETGPSSRGDSGPADGTTSRTTSTAPATTATTPKRSTPTTTSATKTTPTTTSTTKTPTTTSMRPETAPRPPPDGPSSEGSTTPSPPLQQRSP